MKLAWLTDIHLNFLDNEDRLKFYRKIVDTECDAVIITGDIAEATDISYIMTEMVTYIEKPIYFVLGNHDYYRGRISNVREEISKLSATNDKLFWLPASGLQKLGNDTILVGQDGWADGRLGDYQNSTVVLNDSRMIAELFQAKILSKHHLLERMQQLADEDASMLKANLDQAVKLEPKNIIVLTHVPPFKEACMHMGEMSGDEWLPFFSSKVIGDVLWMLASKYPAIKVLVLCGHTHSVSSYAPLANLTVKAGAAEYYHPVIQEILSI